LSSFRSTDQRINGSSDGKLQDDAEEDPEGYDAEDDPDDDEVAGTASLVSFSLKTFFFFVTNAPA
jgi:hypothetical protein